MDSTVVFAAQMAPYFRGLYEGAADIFSPAWDVSLVEDTLDPKDSTTYPAASTHFAPLTAGGESALAFDAASGKYFMVAPEPAGGWVFTAATITDPITIRGFICECGTVKVCGMLVNPISVTANGQTITIPQVVAEVAAAFMVDGTPPIVL